MNALADGGWLGVLSWRELRVWLALYRLADGSNRVRASHGTIATRCGIRREDAARTTKRLERRGLLKVLVRGRTVGKTGKRTANEYELLVPPPVPNSGGGATNEEDE
jgi:Mn-dependent DtxR family transcriptional regulator